MSVSGRVLLGIVILLAVGVLVLPSTVSLFAGQHDWYNIDNPENDIPCQKCHADVFDELSNSPYHINFSGGTANQADEADCGACHQAAAVVGGGLTLANGSGAFGSPGKEAHAAASISCMWCHGYPGNFTAPTAGGFGISGDPADTGAYAAHRPWVLSAMADNPANNTDLLTGPNEACIGCHTHVAVRINWTHAVSLEFNATNTGTGWTTENYNANGTAVRIVWGNAEGTGGLLYNGTTTKSWGTGTWP
ncbi:hypothetical protein Ferp_0668 [Ferroglobus placidus DSM 10642]|uniref:Uncharacterized protein n=1 Tax=Ferroglobus placidus (strain DSM 10642 / AEDII12DO) TaxID=589924 RepID=D3S3K6_FERPA|nr:hypothetical protein [Ferroglobus placidus]ADC64839.1 hypothetical protein Ferp_0668 [Ferroglobus placidus DSM 10642]